MYRRILLKLFAALALCPLVGHAQLTIEISGAGANQIPIAIPPFDGETAMDNSLSDVIRADLQRCGLFRNVETGPQAVAETPQPDFNNWRTRGADALVIASVHRTQDNRIEARFRLFDVVKQSNLAALTYTFAPNDYRAAAHRIADVVYEKLIGEPGMFSTRIAYVEQTGRRYALAVADSDGLNRVVPLRSSEPLISPTWSPDGNLVAYVGFSLKKPVLYILHTATGQIQVLANYKGSNSAPAWAPDGRHLAIVLTKDGPSQLYLINADGSGLRRLTNSGSIDTEPVFSPDGQYIYFTSDRGGSPQIYRIPANGGDAQRITFEGSYNVSPHISPDGKMLAYIARVDGNFHVAVMDLATQQSQILTDTVADESPSFAPNGRYIVYATETGGRGVLSVVSTDGKTKYRLTQQASDIREPAWGPLIK